MTHPSRPTPMVLIRRCVHGALLAALLVPAHGTAHVTAAPDSDSPRDYSHALSLTVPQQGVVQLRLPQDVYLHARSPQLNDVRVFDARGVALPFALRQPHVQTRTERRSLPVKVFPVIDTRTAGEVPAKLDLDVRTTGDGRLISVRMRPNDGGANGAKRLAALVLDLRGDRDAEQEGPLIDALRFTLPAGVQDYSAQVWLEASDDLNHWEAVGAAQLSWLVNRATQTLQNDRLTFDARRMRYARLSWREGEPLQFAGVSAEAPERTEVAAPTEQLLLPAAPGRQAQDLVYVAPVALDVEQIGLQFKESTIVMPVTLGSYRELPSHQLGKPNTWRFEPLVRATFFRITQNDVVRQSGQLHIAPTHASQWVLRGDAPFSARPALRLTWTPATLLFLANGNGPYTLAFGREQARGLAQEVAQVAPGFTEVELAAVAQAQVGALQVRPAADAGAATALDGAASAAATRMAILWGVLLLGIGVLALLVWRLLRQLKAPPSA